METTFPQTAGRIAGTAARYVIQVNRQIDWEEALETFLHGLQVLIAGAMVAAQYTHRAWKNLPAWSEQMGSAYSRLIVGNVAKDTEAPTVESAPVALAPAQNHLWVVAEDMKSMTCAQLKEMVGTKRKLTKAQLIAMAVAC